MRPRLKITIPDTGIQHASVEIDDKPVFLTAIDLILRPQELPIAHVSFHPEFLEIDLDARSVRLNGAQLPEEVGRAFLAQLKELYGDA